MPTPLYSTEDASTMSTTIEITSKPELSSYIESTSPSTLLVLHFYTPWTSYTTKLGPLLSSLASQCPATTPPAIRFLNINAKKLLEIAKEYGISKAPCILFLRSGEVLESIKETNLTVINSAIQRYSGVNTSLVPATPAKPALSPEQLATVLISCHFSRRLVASLNEGGIEYWSFNILTDDDVREGLKEFGDSPTYPQLWVDGEMVGGLDVVQERMSTDPEVLSQYKIGSAQESS
ncbi:thioredoxin [Penicillium malachiteum]|uniref:thioredoxin n=1 Tax=Penicillium malachiteum TaxID=1324776 RepID=UPI0025494A3C|nr:thioredoxin [Penicillium malachiteum]KAJ5715429.1 thioredoxin [Penicillium malachiteum]